MGKVGISQRKILLPPLHVLSLGPRVIRVQPSLVGPRSVRRGQGPILGHSARRMSDFEHVGKSLENAGLVAGRSRLGLVYEFLWRLEIGIW